MKKRDTFADGFKVGNKFKHSGFTADLQRREAEHKRRRPDGHIVKIGAAKNRRSNS